MHTGKQFFVANLSNVKSYTAVSELCVLTLRLKPTMAELTYIFLEKKVLLIGMQRNTSTTSSF
jgi:hypothetical protein